MDERQLSAWLITEGILTSEQVKEALETQAKLKQRGTEEDLVGVLRRLALIGDVQLAQVLERTGYRPGVKARSKQPKRAKLVIPGPGEPDSESDEEVVAEAVEPARENGWGASASGEGPLPAAEEPSAAGWGASATGTVVADEVDPEADDVGEDRDEAWLAEWLIEEQLVEPTDIQEAKEELGELQLDDSETDLLDALVELNLITEDEIEGILKRSGYRRRQRSGGGGLRTHSDNALDESSVDDEDEDYVDSDVGRVAPKKRRKRPRGRRRKKARVVMDQSDDEPRARSSDQGKLNAAKPKSKPKARREAKRDEQPPAPKPESTPKKPAYVAPAVGPGDGMAKKRVEREQQAAATTALAGLVVVAMLVIAGLAFSSVLGGSRQPDETANGGSGQTADPILTGATTTLPDGTVVADIKTNAVKDELAEVEREIGVLEQAKQPGPARVKSLRSKLERLTKRHRLDVAQTQKVFALQLRLDGLAAPSGEEFAKKDRERIEKARVDQAWSQLSERLREVLQQCADLDEPVSPFHRGAEGVLRVSGSLREELARALARAETPDAIAELTGADKLHPAIGVAGYDSLLEELRSFPEALRDSERWERWEGLLPHLEKLKDRAAAYERACKKAEAAQGTGDLALAKRAFRSGEWYDRDAWFRAVVTYLSLDEVIAAFERIKGGGRDYEPELPVRPAGDDKGTRTANVGWVDWKDAFIALEKRYRQTRGPERDGVLDEIERLLGDTLILCRDGYQRAEAIVRFYDGYKKSLWDKQDRLRPRLKQHHEVYFEGAFAAASGPFTYRVLDRWCEEWGYAAWRARLQPFLRLVATPVSAQARAREVLRQKRAAIRAEVSMFAADQLKLVSEALGGLLDWLEVKSYAPAEAKAKLDDLIARAVERAGNKVGGVRLRRRLEQIAHSPPEDPEELAKLGEQFDEQLQQLIDDAVGRSLKAVEKCLSAREPGLAFDLFGYVLLLDPENDRANKGLGKVKINGKWERKFIAKRLKEGFRWDDELGWMLTDPKAEQKYEAGEWYDVTQKRWTTLAEANRLHSDFNNHWVINTEHFKLKTSANLKKSVQIANRLEAFFLACFRQYDLFFQGGAELIFGVAPEQKPLVVNFYKDRAQFVEFANPPTSWAAGFYSGGAHASFFYDTGSAFSDVTVLQHEITHQVLGEYSGGGSDAWLAEGAAVYLEDAFFKDGLLTLGTKQNHSRVVRYESSVRSGGDEHTLQEIMMFSREGGQSWDSGDIGKNYRGAGAAVYFLCNFDNGRYRSDFVEFLKAGYSGRSGRAVLEEFFGLPVEVLNALQERFYNPDAQVDIPSFNPQGNPEEFLSAFEELCKAKETDLDQLSEAYGLLRNAIGALDENDKKQAKQAKSLRKDAARALTKLQKGARQELEKVANKAASGPGRAQRMAELTRLRDEALAVIKDTTIYPDENHGAAGQPQVDEKVNALVAFWEQLPPELADQAVQDRLTLLEVTEPWLDTFETDPRKRGPSAAEVRSLILRRAGNAGLTAGPPDVARLARDEKVRAFNARQTDVPPEIRRQVEVLNDYRAMLGIKALAINSKLCAAAQKHSEWMARSGNFSHTSTLPGLASPGDRCQAEGYAGGVSENIAMGLATPEAAHNAWYRSSGHHRNMIGNWNEIGVGKEGTYWTQNFGGGQPTLE